MIPDIERQWIAEEQQAEAPKPPGWFLAILILLILLSYWRCCG